MRRLIPRSILLVSIGLLCFSVSACSNASDESAADLKLSSELDAVTKVNAPISDDELLPSGSRAVAYVEYGGDVAVLSLGTNACGLTVRGEDSPLEATSVDLQAVPIGQVKNASGIEQYAESGLSYQRKELVVRCGTHGVELCGIAEDANISVVGLARIEESECWSLVLDGA